MRKPRRNFSYDPKSRFITAKEIAAEMRVSVATAYRMIKTMRHVAFEGTLRVAREDFEAWLRGRQYGADGELDPDAGPFVYFVATNGFVKVGWCRSDPVVRLAKLQIGSPHALQLLGAVPGGVELEERVHAALRDHRHRGEWFRDSVDVRGFIAKLLIEGPNACTELRTEVADNGANRRDH
jgi:hypothetical protein